MEISESQQVFNRAAAWWREQLTAPAASKFDNGDTFTSTVASTFAALDRAPVATDAQLAQFEQLLRESFAGQFADGYRTKWSVGVDYDPDQALAEAALAAGMPHNCFPWKTIMWLSVKPGNCYVEVSAGYGGKVERLAL